MTNCLKKYNRSRSGGFAGFHALAFAVLFLAIFGVTSVDPLFASDCTSYSNSDLVYVSGYGWACGGWGPGCTECVDSQSGSSCVTDGSSCEPLQRPVPNPF